MADPWTTPSARDPFYYAVFSPYSYGRFFNDFNGLGRAIYRRIVDTIDWTSKTFTECRMFTKPWPEILNNGREFKIKMDSSHFSPRELNVLSRTNISKSKKTTKKRAMNMELSNLEFIWNDDDALFYQYKSKFLLKYLNDEESTREMSDVTYRIHFDGKEREFLLVIEKSKIDNSKLIAKINKSIKFYLVGDHDVYCGYANEDPTSKEEKVWMMSFKNENDSKKFYDIVTNIQDK
uniref:RanBD1 domain-containing protein n=1 Tax=Strongyloides papillosus TaxID=174720 RepID=A0A0N5BPK3_STREA